MLSGRSSFFDITTIKTSHVFMDHINIGPISVKKMTFLVLIVMISLSDSKYLKVVYKRIIVLLDSFLKVAHFKLDFKNKCSEEPRRNERPSISRSVCAGDC